MQFFVSCGRKLQRYFNGGNCAKKASCSYESNYLLLYNLLDHLGRASYDMMQGTLIKNVHENNTKQVSTETFDKHFLLFTVKFIVSHTDFLLHCVCFFSIYIIHSKHRVRYETSKPLCQLHMFLT